MNHRISREPAGNGCPCSRESCPPWLEPETAAYRCAQCNPLGNIERIVPEFNSASRGMRMDRPVGYGYQPYYTPYPLPAYQRGPSPLQPAPGPLQTLLPSPPSYSRELIPRRSRSPAYDSRTPMGFQREPRRSPLERELRYPPVSSSDSVPDSPLLREPRRSPLFRELRYPPESSSRPQPYVSPYSILEAARTRPDTVDPRELTAPSSRPQPYVSPYSMAEPATTRPQRADPSILTALPPPQAERSTRVPTRNELAGGRRETWLTRAAREGTDREQAKEIWKEWQRAEGKKGLRGDM